MEKKSAYFVWKAIIVCLLLIPAGVYSQGNTNPANDILIQQQAMHSGYLMVSGMSLFFIIITAWRFVHDYKEGIFEEDEDIHEKALG